MSQSVYDDHLWIEELNTEDLTEMVVVYYESVDAVRGHDPNTDTEDANIKKTLRTKKKAPLRTRGVKLTRRSVCVFGPHIRVMTNGSGP
ncbi:hypothetical protein SRHO_G00249650 [Serrasalmus rhombeus]